MPQTKPRATVGELDVLVRQVLAESPEPLSAARISKALPRGLRPTGEVLVRRLRSLAASGVIHTWTRSRFGARAPEEAARQAILGVLEGRALARSKLERSLARVLRGAGEKAVAAALRGLVADGRVFRLPPAPRGRAPRFGLAPANPADYVEPGLSRLVAAIAKKGFSTEAVRAALARALGAVTPLAPAAAASDEDAVVAAIMRLDPQAARGALVYLPHVRVALADRFASKAAFDRAVLALAAQRRVQVGTHPVPAQLSEREREAMVPDGTGGFFMAIGLRQD
jgi:hypothetical protein